MAVEKSSFSRFIGRESAPKVQPQTSIPLRTGAPLHNMGAAPRPIPQSSNPGIFKSTKTSLIFDGIISVALVALFFGLPIFFTGVTFQGIAFEKQIYFYFWL